MPTPGQLEAGVRVGDFEIERRLGAGGMGIVYKARQVSLDRVVALKVLGPALTRPADLERFQREARAAARLTHPGITAIHFIGQDSQVCYHVMEYVDGIPLQRVIDRLSQSNESIASPDAVVAADLTTAPAPVVRFDGPATVTFDEQAEATAEYAPPKNAGRAVGTSGVSAGGKETRRGPAYIRRCCEIVRDVARALAYAHGEGVIHRDIKPENLMLDQAGRVRVIDFGLARYFDDESITHTGQLLGTPLYMSPEQVTGRFQIDHRTDIYSLGLVLYELLALRRPFEATTRENLLRNIITKPLPPLAGRNPAVSGELEAIAHKATAKDPEERYQSAADFADDLERFLAGKPVSAPPYRFRLDMQEVIARRPAALLMTVVNTLLLGGWIFLLAMASASIRVIDNLASHGKYSLISVVEIVMILGGLFFLGTSLLIAPGLLDARKWAMISSKVLHTMSLIGTCCAIWIGISYSSNLVNTFITHIPAIPVLTCSAVAVIGLLMPKSRTWLRFAEQTRQEHQEMLRTLSE